MENKINIVVTDGYPMNPGDLSWEPLENLGNLTIFESTPDHLLHERIENAEVLIVNKRKLSGEDLQSAKNLKLVSISATGIDNVDIQKARELGITVCNAVGYSTPSVAQHVFAMLLSYRNQIQTYNSAVQKGEWHDADHFTLYKNSIEELAGQTMGIYGFGNIGQKVAQIALAFGMKVLVKANNPIATSDSIEFVGEDQLLTQSDIISLHIPLRPENEKLFNKERFSKMKSNSILVNTSRGGVIHELDLIKALDEGEIEAALLDVLPSEPPIDESVTKHSKCYVTPHIAWASKQSRQRLMNIMIDNIKSWKQNAPINVVV